MTNELGAKYKSLELYPDYVRACMDAIKTFAGDPEGYEKCIKALNAYMDKELAINNQRKTILNQYGV